jgi:hypothetical protein
MNGVTLWTEMLALPVILGVLAVMICLFKDERDFDRHHPHHHGPS